MKVVEQGNSGTIQAEEPFGSGGERGVSGSGKRSEVMRRRLLCGAGGLRPALDEAVTVEWEGESRVGGREVAGVGCAGRGTGSPTSLLATWSGLGVGSYPLEVVVILEGCDPRRRQSFGRRTEGPVSLL